MAQTTFYRTLRRDHRCLWFRHLPGPVGSRCEGLESGADINLLLRAIGNPNQIVTTKWVRMQLGRDGRPTLGIRIVDGTAFFNSFPLGTELEIALAEMNPQAKVIGPDSTQPAPPISLDNPPKTHAVDRNSPDTTATLFQAYVMADYSGSDNLAGQRRSIRVAVGEGDSPQIVPGPFTRSSLVRDLVARLADYSRRGIRALVGIDHQFSIPMAFAEEIGLGGLPWREALARLYTGKYPTNGGGPSWQHPRRFAAAFNDFLHRQGQPDYFWSATKRELYGLRHGTNPRLTIGNSGVFRLTELCRGTVAQASPKPLSRLGDNGSVGNQSCCGMGHLLEVLQGCEQDGVPAAVWPMDGLDLQSAVYVGKHVFAEPYPSAKRDRSVVQTDENDALESVRFLMEKDRRGELPAVCDLSTLTPDEGRTVQFEGWILSHLPWNRLVRSPRL